MGPCGLRVQQSSVCHTRWRLHTTAFNPERYSKKTVNTVLGLTTIPHKCKIQLRDRGK